MASSVISLRNAMTQNVLMQQQIQNEQQKNVGVSFQNLSNIGASAKDPTQLPAMLDNYVNAIPPGPSRTIAQNAKQGIISSLTSTADGHPFDPNNPADMAEYNQHRMEFSGIAQQNSDQHAAVFGRPSLIPTGGTLAPASTSLTGAVTPTGNAIPLSMTPAESSTPTPVGFNAQNQPIVGTRGAFVAGQGGGPQQPTNPLAGSTGGQTPPGNTLAPSQGNAAPQGVPTALAPGYEKMVEGAAANYTDEGRKAYEGAVLLKGRLQFMQQDLEGLAQNGGFLNPGTGADARMQFARAINTAAQASGIPDDKLPFDPTKVADAEEFAKETKLAGFALQNSMFGAQREAASVIQASISTQPGLNNSVTGARYLLAGWGELAQREIDRRNFETNWVQTNKGNLIGANEAFNKAYPPEAYAERAVSKVNPPTVQSASDLQKYMPGTYVKRGNGDVVQVPPGMSKYAPVELQGAQ